MQDIIPKKRIKVREYISQCAVLTGQKYNVLYKKNRFNLSTVQFNLTVFWDYVHSAVTFFVTGLCSTRLTDSPVHLLRGKWWWCGGGEGLSIKPLNVR